MPEGTQRSVSARRPDRALGPQGWGASAPASSPPPAPPRQEGGTSTQGGPGGARDPSPREAGWAGDRGISTVMVQATSGKSLPWDRAEMPTRGSPAHARGSGPPRPPLQGRDGRVQAAAGSSGRPGRTAGEKAPGRRRRVPLPSLFITPAHPSAFLLCFLSLSLAACGIRGSRCPCTVAGLGKAESGCLPGRAALSSLPFQVLSDLLR